MKNQEIARVAHEVNRAYCRAIGDHSQPSWKDAPQWQKDSYLVGIQFRIDNPNAPPSASHAQWLKTKKQDGWSYGAEKDTDKRTHPCVVPFEALPLFQQVKDYLFSAVVKALIED